ncbi:MAG: hypothetical protein ACI8V2_000570 [Candidatus Latescibacterota bacterium]|jgi:hypothetical protein
MTLDISAEDQALVETIRKNGIGVLRNLLSAQEVETVRTEFDQAHLDLGKGPGTPGVRDSLSGEALLAYPNLAALYSHPRIMNIISTMLNEPMPWVWVVKTNRYTPEHIGVRKHTDGFLGELAPPFTRQAMAVFLDDVDEASGALMYAPGTHLLHFNDDPNRCPPTQEDIDAGDYIAATPKAGDVVLRVPEVWHAVIPIHRMRRYVTASYSVRGQVSETMSERASEVIERRKEMPLDNIPKSLQPYWIWD